MGFKRTVINRLDEASAGLHILWLTVIFLVIVGVATVGYKLTFGKANANADYSIFQQSQAYNEGMAHELADLQLQYMTATSDEAKAIIRSTVRTRYASYNVSKLNPDLQQFYHTMVQGTN